MDDSSRSIPVRLIALLAVNAPEEHLDVIGRLIGVFSDAELCEKLLEAESPDEAAAVLDRAINGGERQ
jgi:mannitol/fructose-specific phosphotransferase system IIA component (Ntr-type)